MHRLRALPFLLALAVGGCVEPLGLWELNPPQLDDAELRVMFIGNSLTTANNVPAWVQALAEADERSFAHVSLAQANHSLEDHWELGTQDVVRDLRPDVVILQQGTSTLPENRDHLIRWTREFDTVIREAGGQPALFMVWPAAERRSAFPDVWTSYRMAADTVGGMFIPAGQSWVEVWEIEPDVAMYASDGVHQSGFGALTAAMTIYAVLYDLPGDSVPELDVNVTAEQWATLRAGVAAALELADTAGAVLP